MKRRFLEGKKRCEGEREGTIRAAKKRSYNGVREKALKKRKNQVE